MDKEQFLRALTHIQETGDYSQCIVERQVQIPSQRHIFYLPSDLRMNGDDVHYTGVIRHGDIMIGFIAPECAKIGDPYALILAGWLVGERVLSGDYQDYHKKTFVYDNHYDNRFVYCPFPMFPFNGLVIGSIWPEPIQTVFLNFNDSEMRRYFCNRYVHLHLPSPDYIDGYNTPQGTTHDTYKTHHNMSFIPRDAVYQLLFNNHFMESFLCDRTILMHILNYLDPKGLHPHVKGVE